MNRWMLLTLVCGAALGARSVAATSFSTMAFGGGLIENRTTLTIESSGVSQTTNVAVMTRAMAEQYVRLWDQFAKMQDGFDEDEDANDEESEDDSDQPEAGATEAPDYSDAELTGKLRELITGENSLTGADGATRLDEIEVTADRVRSVTSRSFASLAEMLGQADSYWPQSGVMAENIRFEKEGEDRLRITLSPATEARRTTKMMRQQWKLTGFKSEFRLVLPGKIISSGFPHTEENATWIAIDSEDDETLDRALELNQAPLIILAELGGLALDEPLESRRLQRLARQPGGGHDLPLTEAGPGFIAEPLSLTATTLLYFPEGEKHFKAARMHGLDKTGVVVRARLFAPRGRTLQMLSDARVLNALDDQGRTIATADEPGQNHHRTSSHLSSGRAASVDFDLRLPLPPPGAEAIEEIVAEAIAITAGDWKELTLEKVREDEQNELDLSAVLPGAKIVLTKVVAKDRQTTVHATIEGPHTIERLEFELKAAGSDRSHSHLQQNTTTKKGEAATRTIRIQSYSSGATAAAGPLSLEVRYPENLRRDRVEFTLTGLDLL